MFWNWTAGTAVHNVNAGVFCPPRTHARTRTDAGVSRWQRMLYNISSNCHIIHAVREQDPQQNSPQPPQVCLAWSPSSEDGVEETGCLSRAAGCKPAPPGSARIRRTVWSNRRWCACVCHSPVKASLGLSLSLLPAGPTSPTCSPPWASRWAVLPGPSSGPALPPFRHPQEPGSARQGRASDPLLNVTPETPDPAVTCTPSVCLVTPSKRGRRLLRTKEASIPFCPLEASFFCQSLNSGVLSLSEVQRSHLTIRLNQEVGIGEPGLSRPWAPWGLVRPQHRETWFGQEQWSKDPRRPDTAPHRKAWRRGWPWPASGNLDFQRGPGIL